MLMVSRFLFHGVAFSQSIKSIGTPVHQRANFHLQRRPRLFKGFSHAEEFYIIVKPFAGGENTGQLKLSLKAASFSR